MSTEAVVREYVDACNGDSVDRVVAILDPDIELHEATKLPGAVSAVGIDAVKRYVFTVRDGKLLRQDGFDTLAEAEAALAE